MNYAADNSDSSQLVIFTLSEFFYSRSGLDSIVIITDKPEKIKNQLPKELNIYIVCPTGKLNAYNNVLKVDYLNAKYIGFDHLSEDFLRDKLLIYFILSAMSLDFYKKNKRLQKQAAISITSSPRLITKTLKNLPSGFNHKPQISGKAKLYSNSEKKNMYLKVGGRLVEYRPVKPLPVLAVMHVYNEKDIIQTTVRHLLSQGLSVYIIDNWSDDGTYEIIESMAKKDSRVSFERFPQEKVAEFELKQLLTRATDVAKASTKYKWIMLNDADEIRWSPWKGVTLQEAFSFIDSMGFNAVDYTVFNFVPTKEGYDENDDLFSFFQHGEFGSLSGYFVQIKSWRNNKNALLADSGGHHISFPGLKIYPVKFLLSHYPIRSTAHGLNKIFKERLPRFSKKERNIGWHVQYNDVSKNTNFIKKSEDLIKVNSNAFFQDYVVERISGIGIKREED